VKKGEGRGRGRTSLLDKGPTRGKTPGQQSRNQSRQGGDFGISTTLCWKLKAGNQIRESGETRKERKKSTKGDIPFNVGSGDSSVLFLLGSLLRGKQHEREREKKLKVTLSTPLQRREKLFHHGERKEKEGEEEVLVNKTLKRKSETVPP